MDTSTTKKIIGSETASMHHMVGDGFRVHNMIPGYGREMNNMTSPFLMLDYNAPWEVSPHPDGHRPGVGFHPHRGFETVTIVYSGGFEHRDTAGGGGQIGADEVQWMTAGSGLLHEEKMSPEFARTGGTQHAIQLWINLPREYKMTTPRYQALTRKNIKEVEFDAGVVRVIAGDFQGHAGAAKTFSPIELYDVRFDKAGKLDISLPDGFTTMILVTEGIIAIGERTYTAGKILYFSRSGSDLLLESQSLARLLVMAGEPIDEPIAHYGPFVMNTEAELMQAFADLNSGKMGRVTE